MKKLIVVFVFLNLTSCATLLNNRNQDITVTSNVSGVIYLDNKFKGNTPFKFDLSTKQNVYNIRVESDGYIPQTKTVRTRTGAGWVVTDIFLTGLLGVIVDGITKKWNSLETDKLEFNLAKYPEIEGRK